MAERSISQELRLKNIDEAKTYFIEETIENDFTSKKGKKICTTLNCFEQLLALTSVVTECISISAFDSLGGIPIGNTSCALGLKIYAILQELKSISQ